MDMATQQFIENSTLLFIATRNAEGALDVSPRGGQPTVLRLTSEGRLLLPDYLGNNRLDTIGNLLSNPRVALILLNRGSDRYLRIAADAEISFLAEDIACFPADENMPISVIALTPRTLEFVASPAFGRAGFWVDPDRRRPPLDLGAIIGGDKIDRAAAGFAPVPKNQSEERLLADAGVRAVYGQASDGVQKKVCDIAGPGGLRFMQEATFTVLAHENARGEIALDVTGEAPLSVMPLGNRHAYHLSLADDVATGGQGECALLTVVPGQNELLRINGLFEQEPNAVRITPREVFFHCSAALSRSRIWQRDRRGFWSGKRRFICIGWHRENPDVVSFMLRPCDRAPIGPVQPGQYVTVALASAKDAPPQRSYSVSGRSEDGSLRISVRRLGAGGVSDLLHDTLQPGAELLVGAPAGRFVLSTPPGRPAVLVSAGVGITPLLPMLGELVRQDSGRPVWFIHAARDGAHHLFEDEARAIAGRATKGAICLLTCYSRPRDGDRADIVGRLDANALARLTPVAEADYYLCGPDTFMTALRDGLIARGADPDRVRFETFAASAGAALNLSGRDDIGTCEITFARSEKSAVWSPSDGSLLDIALKNNVDVAYSCRQGDCQSCVQIVLGGVVDYPGAEAPLLAWNQVMLCQAIPRGDLVLDC